MFFVFKAIELESEANLSSLVVGRKWQKLMREREIIVADHIV